MAQVVGQGISAERESVQVAVRQFGRIAAVIAMSVAVIGVLYYLVLYIAAE